MAVLKLGNGDQTRLPVNTLIKNNIFYKSQIEDNTILPAAPYTCAHNLLFATLDSGFTGSGCTDTVDQDPQFAGAMFADFRLLATSPAIHAGEAQVDLGALSLLQPTSVVDLPYHLYLPTVPQSLVVQLQCTP